MCSTQCKTSMRGENPQRRNISKNYSRQKKKSTHALLKQYITITLLMRNFNVRSNSTKKEKWTNLLWDERDVYMLLFLLSQCTMLLGGNSMWFENQNRWTQSYFNQDKVFYASFCFTQYIIIWMEKRWKPTKEWLWGNDQHAQSMQTR